MRLQRADLGRVLAIGCGRQAALATRLLRARGAWAVQVLDPRVTTKHWDIVVAPRHDRLRGANVVALEGSLNPVTDAWLGASRAAFAAIGALPQPRISVLVGGPTGDVKLRRRDLDRALRELRRRIEQSGGSVLATTSRRTPEKYVALVRKRLAGLPGLVWTGSVDGRNPYAALLGWSDAIVCTADSVNMLSEACATHAPVEVVGARRARGRVKRFIAGLLATSRARAFGAVASSDALTPLRETVRVAQLVRKQVGLRDA